MYRELNIIPYHQCDKLLGLAKGLENHQIAGIGRGKHQKAKNTSKIIKLKRLAKMYM